MLTLFSFLLFNRLIRCAGMPLFDVRILSVLNGDPKSMANPDHKGMLNGERKRVLNSCAMIFALSDAIAVMGFLTEWEHGLPEKSGGWRHYYTVRRLERSLIQRQVDAIRVKGARLFQVVTWAIRSRSDSLEMKSDCRIAGHIGWTRASMKNDLSSAVKHIRDIYPRQDGWRLFAQAREIPLDTLLLALHE